MTGIKSLLIVACSSKVVIKQNQMSAAAIDFLRLIPLYFGFSS